ncbi:MAG: glycosyltransferase [Alphaproteobacteria bacterium]
MKVLLLSDPQNIHTIRWVEGLEAEGVIVEVFGIPENITSATEGAFKKLKALKVLPELWRKIKDFKPDIVHAHYATSYGILGSLCFFRPYFLSVWGRDVYTFPKRSSLHKALLKFNLWRADRIFSTSHAMRKETKLYTKKKIDVVPFGIDASIFKVTHKNASPFHKDAFVIGTVKVCAPKYGIDILIRAFKILKENNPRLPLKLLIVGGGPHKENLMQLVKSLGLQDDCVFTGQVSHDRIPAYHNAIDVSVFPSRCDSESFGVSVIEACACKNPVVVSNVGGLPEVVENNKTGFVVPPENPDSTATAIQRFIDNPELIATMGENGRARVKALYAWKENIKTMLDEYKKAL